MLKIASAFFPRNPNMSPHLIVFKYTLWHIFNTKLAYFKILLNCPKMLSKLFAHACVCGLINLWFWYWGMKRTPTREVGIFIDSQYKNVSFWKYSESWTNNLGFNFNSEYWTSTSLWNFCQLLYTLNHGNWTIYLYFVKFCRCPSHSTTVEAPEERTGHSPVNHTGVLTNWTQKSTNNY